MGQILLEDKIGTLSHSTGVINLAASRLTIGGQQYNTSALSRTISTDITIAANTRYQIFAVVSGEAVSLRISSNENSVGPSGFNTWKLVGSFYSATTDLGSFVNIEGMPTSNFIGYVPTLTNISLGSGGQLQSVWRRIGDSIEIRGGLEAGVGPSISSIATVGLPTGLVIDNTKPVDTGFMTIGSGTIHNSGIFVYNMGVIIRSGTAFNFVVKQNDAINGNSVSTNTPQTSWFTQGDNLSWTLSSAISGWNNTPIKDL